MALAAECFLPSLQPTPARRSARQLACPLPQPAPAPPQQHSWACKDYTQPLHVDCSVEYELPECAKPPQGVKIEPLLMIHPAHFRRLDSLRRCPFVNNLPAASAADGVPFELPPPPSNGNRRACRRARAASPERRRWPPAGSACCQALVQQYGGCPAPPPPDAQLAPKEGDTLENSSFGKCAPPPPRYRRPRAHPYALEPPPLDRDTALPPNCDKTFDALQGNPLISPFHAKMFSSESVYQNYPIVMYK